MKRLQTSVFFSVALVLMACLAGCPPDSDDPTGSGSGSGTDSGTGSAPVYAVLQVEINADCRRCVDLLVDGNVVARNYEYKDLWGRGDSYAYVFDCGSSWDGSITNETSFGCKFYDPPAGSDTSGALSCGDDGESCDDQRQGCTNKRPGTYVEIVYGDLTTKVYTLEQFFSKSCQGSKTRSGENDEYYEVTLSEVTDVPQADDAQRIAPCQEGRRNQTLAPGQVSGMLPGGAKLENSSDDALLYPENGAWVTH